jgi:hypothetical protein
MGIERTMSSLVVTGALAWLLSACSSSDAKGVDYSTVQLRINELQASNQITATDEYGEADDWIELYNAGKDELDLTDFYISDSASTPTKYRFPAGVTVPAGDVVMIWADGTPAQGANHVSFKLSASGETVSISDPNANELDSEDFTVGTAGYSYARHPDGTGAFDWCVAPTPGELNGDACPASTL